ncbi:MAG TPA: FecR domain-containing protein [Methylosinus sp.]|jgi:transmembrane sensor|uniref:FecR family protein n=1 Tax=Methylosinus sp. TaxID=427 RepID=UPI002F959693
MAEERNTGDPQDIRAAAVDWWVRGKIGALSRSERAAFEAWLASDPRHRAAFEDIAGFTGYLETFGAPVPRARGARALRRLGAAVLVAASLFLAVDFMDLVALLRSDYRTGVGEARLVTLEDGSVVHLAPKSALAIRRSASERRVALLAGEAWFQVAPDAARPFVVEAAGGTVTARGTAFDVAVDDDEAEVAVTEHGVEVASGGARTLVGEGQESAFERDRAARPPEPANVARVTAWRRGKLIVNDQRLRDVLTALGRYRRGLVFCVPTSACERRVSGVFGVDDPSQTLAEIEANLGLRPTYLSNYLIFLHE